MKFAPKKGNLLKNEVKFLRHIVSKGGILKDPAEVIAMKDWLTLYIKNI